MKAAEHLKRYPNARPSTVAYLIRRDEMVRRLKRETQERKGWKLPKLLHGLAEAVRDMWRA